MTKLPPRIALGIGLLILGAMHFIPVMNDHYMRENVILAISLGLPAFVMLVNLVARGRSIGFHLQLCLIGNVILFLLLGLLLFMYFAESSGGRVRLQPGYFLPAFALLMNGMAMARWKADAAPDTEANESSKPD